ncbi:zinc finger protein Xfin isoform X2 [Tribolium castaneum]|uniref:zinc finger protein Xfin isoform X2 n=1 Tax=Tribolium castaneum TaxID=7070 RepID=UPI00077DD2E2|nr:PREDICTED: zinc finger protein Xfin isoform X2 [Tribolium castaneum]|eukprot:XP_015836098.1 PREDICTED: zinc finger protein Xfin isoform X2 [Tribolium castaneum]
MEVAMPMSGTAIDCYEDMFKEITRKLYGEDGLPELTGTERLPTNQDRGLTPIDYDVDNPILKPEEHLTAFGLAALMQNGFPTTGILNSTFQQHKTTATTTVEDKWTANEDALQWTQSKIATYNPSQKLFRCAECDCVGYLPRVAEHWLGTHSNLRAFQCPQCPYESAWARCVRMHLSRQHNINTDEASDTLAKNNPILQEITKYLQRLKNKLENNCAKPSHINNSQILDEFQSSSTSTNNHLNNNQVVATNSDASSSSSTKRYTCTYCPYATDRRDLFTRHENIHREEKPFQCYVCQKQFNRADHVKKHFLRMHREHPYDLNRIRRHPPKNASGMSYYQKYNANSTNQSPDSISSLANINSLSIPNGFNNISRNANNIRPGNGKKKGEKRFTCCYCSWSGVDNWCLKRHMNTHLKPFVCGLCDYKAARSERLATHVLKVHNKRACGKCSFLADDPAQLTVHQQEHHPLEQRNRSGNNILRNNSFNNSTATSSSSCSQSQTSLKPHELSAAAALLQHSNRLLQNDNKWKNHAPKQHGAARLFNYMEASDGSEPESESRGAEDMSRLNLNHRIQSDFLEAGDVGSQADEEEGEEMELPLFVCPTCGCEFEDDMSLETHQYTHRHSTTSPAKSDNSKENVNPNLLKYRCCLCDFAFENQSSVMAHMVSHSSLSGAQAKSTLTKRSRKQSRPKKMVLPFWDLNEVEVLRHLNGNLSGELQQASASMSRKYMARIVARKGLYCVLCKSSSVNRYHTKASLALHHYWKHLNKRFKCEHCDLHFRHRYQCVLHASREHINKPPILKSQTVPIKEPIHSAVPASQDAHHFFANSQTVTVPDASSNAHKIGMSFFDHSFIHPTNAINSHMPIIIPTFPPN